MLRGDGRKLSIRLTTADVGAFLTLANQEGITIYDLNSQSDLEFSFLINNEDFSSLKSVVERQDNRIEIIGHRGGFGFVSNIFMRPVLMIMIVVFAFLTCFLPSRILFVIVEGNVLVREQEIVDAAAGCGIRFGAVRRELRSEICKNHLLSEIPQLQWVGLNTYGCVAKISVKERTLQEDVGSVSSFSGLSATADGVIREMTVTSGNPICKVGDAVEKGQLLVSPYEDGGVLLRGVVAQAEIYGDTKRSFMSVTPRNTVRRRAKTRVVKKFSIRIGKKVINFFKDSGILDTSCVKMYKEHTVMFGDGFVFPISLLELSYVHYDVLNNACVSEQELAWIPSVAERMVMESMTFGGIRRSQFRTDCDDMLFYYNGQYDCYEMIAQPYHKETVNKYG